MSPAAVYVPQASTARSMTVSLSSGSMMVTGMSGAWLANASIIGCWSLPMMTAALMVCAWSLTRSSNRLPLARPPAIQITDLAGKLDSEARAAWPLVALESSTKRTEPPSTAASATVSMRWPPGLNEVSAFNAVSRSAPSPSTNANAVNASATRCGYSEPSGSARCVKSVMAASLTDSPTAPPATPLLSTIQPSSMPICRLEGPRA